MLANKISDSAKKKFLYWMIIKTEIIQTVTARWHSHMTPHRKYVIMAV